jgi:two-component system response regulator FixJ
MPCCRCYTIHGGRNLRGKDSGTWNRDTRMKQKPTVFVVDDDAGMRDSTGILLEAASLPCVAYDSAEAFLADYHRDLPGCLLLDLHMPGLSGMALIEQLRAQKHLLPVIVISGTGTIMTVVQGMKLGVVDFLEKPLIPRVLISKITAAIALDSELRTEATGQAALHRRLSHLTLREGEVLELVVGGESNKSIAGKLEISVKTVENHRARIMVKTGSRKVADLVRLCHLARVGTITGQAA